MNSKTKHVYDKIISQIALNRDMDRSEWRELLEEIECEIEARLDALDEEDDFSDDGDGQ